MHGGGDCACAAYGDALIEEEERAKAKAAKGKVSGVGAERCGGLRCE